MNAPSNPEFSIVLDDSDTPNDVIDVRFAIRAATRPVEHREAVAAGQDR